MFSRLLSVLVIFFLVAAAPAVSQEMEEGDTWAHGHIRQSTKDTFYAKTIYFRIQASKDGETKTYACSGNLVSDTIALTAGHCFKNAVKVKAFVGSWQQPQENTTSKRMWLYSCDVKRSWGPDNPSAFTSNDWAVAELAHCKKYGKNKAVTQTIGYYVGHNILGTIDPEDSTSAVYAGYPSVGEAGSSHLQKFVANPTGCSGTQVAAYPSACKTLMRVTSYKLAKGGSGGALMRLESGQIGVVVGVANFHTDDSETFFRKVDATIINTVTDAEAGTWPKGTTVY